MATTHEVFNQPTPLVDYNLYATNRPLRDALAFHLPGSDEAPRLAQGARWGSSEWQTHARLANTPPPRLLSHDRFGRRIDQVEFHPSYHALMGEAVAAGLHGTPWSLGPGAHVERAAAFMQFTELEPSILCPISMTYAVTPALRANGAVFDAWFARLSSTAYDARLVPFTDKPGVTMGMGMTEKQGGSDVRANSTRAEFEADDAWGRRFRLELPGNRSEEVGLGKRHEPSPTLLGRCRHQLLPRYLLTASETISWICQLGAPSDLRRNDSARICFRTTGSSLMVIFSRLWADAAGASSFARLAARGLKAGLLAFLLSVFPASGAGAVGSLSGAAGASSRFHRFPIIPCFFMASPFALRLLLGL